MSNTTQKLEAKLYFFRISSFIGLESRILRVGVFFCDLRHARLHTAKYTKHTIRTAKAERGPVRARRIKFHASCALL